MENLRRLVAAVRRVLLARAAVRGMALWGPILGVAALAVAWLSPEWPRWPALALLALGPLGGLLHRLRRMPPEADLVLYVDRRLDAHEAVLTAWDLRGEERSLDAETRRRAEERLAGARRRDVRPRLLGREAFGLPVTAGALTAAMMLPIPPAPATPPGTDEAKASDVEVLRRIEQLPELAPEDDARKEALTDAARQARELREALAEGMEQREALDGVGRVRESLERARKPETAQEKRAREAAMEALAEEPGMQRALALRDPEALEREAQKAAARERQDRARAREALKEAAEAARQQGDEGLARLLERRESLLRRRGEQADLARELMEGMPEFASDELKRELQRLERDGEGGELTREMVEAMREAWSRLTPEEREKLAEAIKEAQKLEAENRQAREAAEGEPEALSADEMEERLREMLEHLDDLQGQVGSGQCNGGAVPIPKPGGGSGSGGGGQSGGSASNEGGSGQGSSGEGGSERGGSEQGGSSGAGGGPGEGGGPGARGGHTDPVDATDGPLARVRPDSTGQGAPIQSWEWVDPAGTRPAGGGDGRATGTAAEGEGGAIEREPIPQDYREHVRTYFGGSE